MAVVPKTVTMIRSTCIAAFALTTILTTFSTGEARADMLDPGTRPAFATFALGPAIGVVDFPITQFKLEQELGYHFSGDSSGPALGLSIGESFGGGFGSNFVFQPGMKFWYDIQITDMAIYIAPQARIGYVGYFGAGDSHGFNFGFGAEGKVILGDRGVLFFRPFTLDMMANDFGFVMRYDLMFGGGVTF